MQPNSAHIIDSFRGGISDENDKGIAGAFKFGYGLSIRERDDVMKCNFALAKESGAVVTELINFMVPCTDGNSYHFGAAGGIYKRTSAGVWSKVYTGVSGAILGADEWNGYFYWATATALNTMVITGNWTTDVNSVSGWPKALTSAAWHTMIKATGNLLICNANYLAMVDFSTPAVFTASALNLIPGNLAKCLEEDGDLVLVGSTRSDNDEQGHLWSWEPTALNWIKKKKIASKGVNAFITSELMLVQCGIDGEVYYSDMINKVPVFIFPDGGYCLPGGTAGRKGLAMFGVSGNSSSKCGIYSYGRNRKNFAYTLSLDYVPSPGLITGIDIGAIQTINGTLLVAWKNGTDYGVDALSTTTRATAVYESLEWNGGKGLCDRVKSFLQTKIEMDPLPASCSISLKYKMDRAAAWTVAKTIDGQTSFTTTGKTTALFNINAKGKTIELQVTLTPNAGNTPVVRSLATFFNMTAKALI